jgi:UDPglucose--hexose-1-phosphate uridylyltransferase
MISIDSRALHLASQSLTNTSLIFTILTAGIYKMPIEFRKEERFAELLTPLKDYELEKQPVEHRYDPLTGREIVIATGRFQYVKRNFESERKVVLDIAESTKQTCPFCPAKLERSTPKFPPNIVAEGKIVVGESVLFPSLFAHMDYNAVAVLSREHYLTPKEIAPERVHAAFRAGTTYLARVRSVDKRTLHACFMGNYYPLSGSSVIHPHMHVVASDLPFQLLRELLDRSREYYSENRSNYWLDLIDEEESSERHIGGIGETVWLTPYAPSNTYEVWAISKRHSDFLDMREEDFRSFAEGLGKVLSFYEDEQLSCFNFALYSGPIGEDSDSYFRVGLRVLGRFGYKPPYVSDMWGLQVILMEGEAYDTPENMAQKLKKYFL